MNQGIQKRPGWFFSTTAAVLLALIALQAISAFLFDPLGALRGTSITTQHTNDRRWQAPGLIKAMPRPDVVVLGSSMSEGFTAEMFGVPPETYLNLAFSAAAIEEEVAAARYLLQHSNPRIIVWELNPSAMIRRQMPAGIFTQNYFPDFLYSDAALDQARYLLSPRAAESLFGLAKDHVLNVRAPKLEELGTWTTNPENFGKDRLLAAVCKRTGRSGPYTNSAPLFAQKMRDHVLPLVKSYPETRFVFFIPAFPDVWPWLMGSKAAEGLAESEVEMAQALVGQLNVRFVSFVNAPFIHDWHRYSDEVHHDAAASNWEAAQLTSGRSDSVEAVRDAAKAILADFDEVSRRLSREVSEECWTRLSHGS